jgi:hypothetical protein
VGDRHRQPEVALDEAADRRHVLQHEEEAERGEGEEDGERGELVDAPDHAVGQRFEAGAHRRVGVGVRLGGGRRLRPEVAGEGLDLGSPFAQPLRERVGLARDPREDHQPDGGRDQHDREEDDDGADAARDAALLEPVDHGRGDRGDDRGGEHRHDDRLGLPEQPYGADQGCGDSNQEPRGEAEVAQPLGSGEDAAQRARLDFYDLVTSIRALAPRTAQPPPEDRSPLAHRHG